MCSSSCLEIIPNSFLKEVKTKSCLNPNPTQPENIKCMQIAKCCGFDLGLKSISLNKIKTHIYVKCQRNRRRGVKPQRFGLDLHPMLQIEYEN